MIKKFLIFLLLLSLPLRVFAQPISIAKETNKELYKVKNLGDEGKDEIIIGDELNPTTFKPQLKITKWNKENYLTIKIPSKDLFISTTPTLLANKLEIGNAKTGFYFNPDPDNTERFRFGIIWKEKPASNKFSFELAGYENYNFYYQPILVNVEKDSSSWEGTKGERCAYRPADVGGSYAIYHKTKVNHEIGKTNYGTGKMFHWYKPKFIDANQEWTWGILEYKDGVMTETCPQEFLDKAVYPVRSNAIFGNQNLQASHDTFTDGSGQTYTVYIPLSQLSPAGTNILNYLSFYLDTTSGTQQTRCGLYSNSSGYPVSRLVYDTSKFNFTGGTGVWVTNIVDYNYTLAASTQYFAAIYTNDIDVVTLHYDSAGTLDSKQEYNVECPELANAGSDYDDVIYSVYATYTPSAARRIIFIQ